MINETLRNIRNEKEYTQEEVGKAIGVTAQTVLKWERGDSEPKLKQLQRLAKFYGLPISVIIDEPEISLHQKAKAKLTLIEQLSEDEQKVLFDVIEAMVLRSQQRKIKEQFED